MKDKKESSQDSHTIMRRSLESLKSLELLEQAVETTNRSCAYLEKTENCAVEILAQLKQQGEQLGRVEGNLDAVKNSQEEAKKHLRALSSIFNVVLNKFRKTPAQSADRLETDKLIAKEEKKYHKAIHKERKIKEENAKPINLIEKAYLDLNEKELTINKQVNSNLARMSGQLDQLKEKAQDMGYELDKQNIRLERMQKHTVEATETMQNLEARVWRQ